MLTLDATKRDLKEDVALIRKGGNMPAVYYGKKTDSTPISVSQKEFIKVWHKAGESSVVSIKTSEGTVDALIKDVNVDPVSDMPRHADFYVFEKGKKIEVSVPLEFVGVSGAVKDLGGILIKALHDLKIMSDPTNLPQNIQVDISSLATFESVILAKDLKLPAGVTLAENEEEVVAAVGKVKEETEETAPVDLSAIEVEKKGKKEEEAPAE